MKSNRSGAFYLTREAAGASGSFVIAGSDEAEDGAGGHFAHLPLARLDCGSVPVRHHVAD